MTWFTAKAMADNPRAAQIVIDKPIGSDWAPDWISDFTGQEPARQFIEAVEGLGELDEIHLELNSPGGDVASGVRIFNYLRNHRAAVHVRVTGQAASIATVVMMAGDTRVMGVGTTIMTHRAASLMVGFYTAAEMKEMARNVDVIDAAVVDAYVASTGKTAEEIGGLLDQGDTFMGADEAIEWGFATDQDAKLKAVACADTQMFMSQIKQQGKIRQLEAQLKGGSATMTAADALALAFDLTPEQAEAQAADLGDQIIEMKKKASPATETEAADVVAGFIKAFPSLSLAMQANGEGKPVSLIAKALQMDAKDIVADPDKAVQAIDALRTSGGQDGEAVAAERARVTAIVKACQTTGQPQLLDKLVENGMSETQASEYIFDVAAASGNKQHINGNHSPEGGHKAAIDYYSIYARQNRQARA